MLTYREITPQDEQLVMPMVEQFYRSDAVDHPVPRQVMLQAFQAAADPKEAAAARRARAGGGQARGLPLPDTVLLR